MNREYNCKVSSKNSKRLLKNLQNTTGDYFFLPHPVDPLCVTIHLKQKWEDIFKRDLKLQRFRNSKTKIEKIFGWRLLLATQSDAYCITHRQSCSVSNCCEKIHIYAKITFVNINNYTCEGIYCLSYCIECLCVINGWIMLMTINQSINQSIQIVGLNIFLKLLYYIKNVLCKV